MGIVHRKTTDISIDVNGVLRFENDIEAVSPCAFRCRDDFQEIVFPETIRTIGEQAFSNCHNLKILDLPNHLASMGLKLRHTIDHHSGKLGMHSAKCI